MWNEEKTIKILWRGGRAEGGLVPGDLQQERV